MDNVVFFYSGTGNSLWAARCLAEDLGGCPVVSIKRPDALRAAEHASRVGMVFPVYIFGLPRPVARFARSLRLPASCHLFAACTNGGGQGSALGQLDRILSRRGMRLSAGHSLLMPSNYTPMGGPGTRTECERMFDDTRVRIRLAARAARDGTAVEFTPGTIAQRAIYALTYPLVHWMDGRFTADGKCTSCGMCARVCPADNIVMRGDRPSWRHRCEQCFGCLQWCPAQAIQWGKNTSRTERYHHPEVKASDLIEARRGVAAG